MKIYKSFDEIDYELSRLKLEKQIAWDMKPLNWVNTAVKLAGKYGVLLLMKKFIRR